VSGEVHRVSVHVTTFKARAAHHPGAIAQREVAGQRVLREQVEATELPVQGLCHHDCCHAHVAVDLQQGTKPGLRSVQ
jgi:hypothetical protein